MPYHRHRNAHPYSNPLTMTPHETGFLTFIDKRQARRVGVLLEDGARSRGTLRELLPHNIRLIPAFAERVPPAEQTPGGIYALLLARDAPDMCHVISENPEIDHTDMPLDASLQATVGMGFGTFISCIPGSLGYFEYEGRNERYILHRK